ncbi:Alpha-xylosidase [compost metagenome]
MALHLFELGDGHTASTAVYSTKAELELEVSVERTGRTLTVTANGAASKPWELVLRGVTEVKSIVDGTLVEEAMGLRVIPEAGTQKITIELNA